MLAYNYGRTRMDGVYNDYQLLCSDKDCVRYFTAADIADHDERFSTVEWMELKQPS